MTMNMIKLRIVVCTVVSAVICGCTTYTSPFAHKTEQELEAMDAQSATAAQSFASGDYAASDRILSELASELTVSTPQYELERVSVLLHQGRKKEAHELMVKVRNDLEMLFDEKAEKEAVSLWHGENKKVFKGDAHERATLYALLALSFMEMGEWEDAERSVKNGLLCDSANTDQIQYNSDYAILHYLGYVACRRSGRDSDASEYLRELSGCAGEKMGEALQKAEIPNAFIVVWGGTPPAYYRGGTHNEIRHIVPGSKNPFSYLAVKDKGGKYVLAPAGLADVNFQATTRGGREMDEVLRDKAAVKSGMEASANILLIAGLGCFSAMGGGNPQADLVLGCVGTGCVVLGGTFYIVGECINSEADIRSWKTLPGEFLIVPLTLPDGKRTIEVNGYRLRDQVVRKTVDIEIKPDAVVSAHLSIMNFKSLPDPSSLLLQSAIEVAKGAEATPSKDIPSEIKSADSKGGAK